MSSNRLVVIGGGIASEVFLFYLLQEIEKNPPLFKLTKSSKIAKIIQIYSEKTMPACSLKSTSFVCRNGVEKNLSPLGDNLYEACVEVEKFFEKHSPEGLTKGEIKHFISPESEAKFIRRFKTNETVSEDCYFFSPELFINWLRKKNQGLKHYFDFEIKDEEVLEVNTKNSLVKTKNNEEIHFDKIFLAPGAYYHFFPERFHLDNTFLSGQVVSGSYLKFTHDYGVKSFGLSFWEGYCIYRSDSKELLIGSISTNCKTEEYQNNFEESHALINHQKLAFIYSNLATKLNGFIQLPPLEKARMELGFRHKGIKRRPFWGQLNNAKGKNIAVLGLYKNGYSLAFLAAKITVQDLFL